MRLAIATVAVVAACNPYDEDLGPTPFLCGPTEPRCPHGYSCNQDPASGQEVCSATTPTEIQCADDSAHEPNESTSEPTPTTFDTDAPFELGGLAICPDDDRDVFEITVTNQESVELIVTYQDGGALLEAAILNTGGVPIANATPVDMTSIRAVAQNLIPGTYYAQVTGPADRFPKKNNYSLTLDVLP